MGTVRSPQTVLFTPYVIPRMNRHVVDSTVLQELMDLSHELGRPERHLAILGEGNTSADAGDDSFWIKGSGTQLANIRPDQFTRVRTASVLWLLKTPNLDDRGIETALRDAQLNQTEAKPSIETLLHAICLTLGQAHFVGHTHAEAVNQILCSDLGAKPFLGHIFPDAAVVCGRLPLVVPYADPGLPVALSLHEALHRYLNEQSEAPKMILMLNHGLVALGHTAREVLNITLMAEKWARILAGSLQIGGSRFISSKSVDRIDGRHDEHYRRRQLNQ